MRVNNKCDTIRLRREVEKEKRWLNDARQEKKTETTKREEKRLTAKHKDFEKIASEKR